MHVPLKVPELLVLNVTVPPSGVMGVPVSVSATVTVHVTGEFTGTEADAQVTLVEVVR